MIIEINKDIDKYQESIVLGLTARQLIFSVASIIVGGGIVLLLYKYIGLTGAAYVAVPCIAPIALEGFYSYNGMSFMQYWMKKIYFMIGNRTLTYISAEGEAEIQKYKLQENNTKAKKGRKDISVSDDDTNIEENNNSNKEEFEAMKNKMKKTIIGTIIGVVLAVIGAVAYKYFRG
ncbi:MAG: PrgI family protein [Eubacterium sp.]|nr:PrgI family protein [Eubacterium sp.]